MQLSFEELLERVSVEIDAAVREALTRTQGTIVEGADVRQEILVHLYEIRHYIEAAEHPITYTQEAIRNQAQRCLTWLLPTGCSRPEPREGDKIVYANDRERDLTGAQAVAYAHSQEAGEDFNIADH